MLPKTEQQSKPPPGNGKKGRGNGLGSNIGDHLELARRGDGQAFNNYAGRGTAYPPDAEFEEEKQPMTQKKAKAGEDLGEQMEKIVLRDAKAKLITFEMISINKFSIT